MRVYCADHEYQESADEKEGICPVCGELAEEIQDMTKRDNTSNEDLMK